MTNRRTALQTLVTGVALGFSMVMPIAHAQDKGTVGVSMPTKSSTRWISDGKSMVDALTAKGYKLMT